MSVPQVFIGYDAREAVAFDVLKHSILRRSSIDLNVRPLMTADLSIYTRPRHPNQSTDFAFTRFLVPYLSGYEGVSIFLDCDMLMRADIAALLPSVEQHAVAVCQHDYTPKGFLESHADCGLTRDFNHQGEPFLQHSECDECRRRATLGIYAQGPTKFLGQPQTAYPRKNWSSLMVFQNSRCRSLTPYYVNRASAADLHRLAWVPDHAIGALPLDWNWLVGEMPPNPEARNYHWTLGGPWFVDSEDVDHADLWREEYEHMRASKGRAA